jgi:hypothetical protein
VKNALDIDLAVAAALELPRGRAVAAKPHRRLVMTNRMGTPIVPRRGAPIEVRIATHIDRSRYPRAHDGGKQRPLGTPIGMPVTGADVARLVAAGKKRERRCARNLSVG